MVVLKTLFIFAVQFTNETNFISNNLKMGKRRLQVEIVLAVTSALIAGEQPTVISKRFGISDSSVSRIRQKYAPQLKYQRIPNGTPEHPSNQLQLDLPAPIVKVFPSHVAPEPIKRNRTITIGGCEFVFPDTKNYRFTVNENHDVTGFDQL